jgi:hypothetical protein
MRVLPIVVGGHESTITFIFSNSVSLGGFSIKFLVFSLRCRVIGGSSSNSLLVSVSVSSLGSYHSVVRALLPVSCVGAN